MPDKLGEEREGEGIVSKSAHSGNSFNIPPSQNLTGIAHSNSNMLGANAIRELEIT